MDETLQRNLVFFFQINARVCSDTQVSAGAQGLLVNLSSNGRGTYWHFLLNASGKSTPKRPFLRSSAALLPLTPLLVITISLTNSSESTQDYPSYGVEDVDTLRVLSNRRALNRKLMLHCMTLHTETAENMMVRNN